MVPDYQSLMLPLLKLVADKQEHKYRDLIERLATEFQLTNDDRRELLASGGPIFDNRVGWAKTYLKKAGLLDSPKRATFVITDLGLATLEKNLDRIDAKYLRQFPSFLEFQNASRNENELEEETPLTEPNLQTPEESLDKSYQRIRKSLASELLTKVVDLSSVFFERLVVDLLVKMGYGGSIKDAGKAIGKSGDEGIDGTIKEDKLGLDIIYIQAKRWRPGNVVGRPEIQKFVGALAGQGAKKGIFITTSSFTKEAIEYTPKNETKIVLIDGEQLAQLMIDHNLGCTTQQIYELKKIDSDYFDEE